jgi:hypothetical protein
MSQYGIEQEADQHRLALRLAPHLGMDLGPESILLAVHQVFGQLVHRVIPLRGIVCGISTEAATNSG